MTAKWFIFVSIAMKITSSLLSLIVAILCRTVPSLPQITVADMIKYKPEKGILKTVQIRFSNT